MKDRTRQPSRLFIGVYPCGLVYADREREKAGDYLRLAFLPYSSLVLEWDAEQMPDDLRQAILADAAHMETLRGQPFQISTAGQ
jgi:hypothetical protein